jgi:hypothetical protein
VERSITISFDKGFKSLAAAKQRYVWQGRGYVVTIAHSNNMRTNSRGNVGQNARMALCSPKDQLHALAENHDAPSSS